MHETLATLYTTMFHWNSDSLTSHSQSISQKLQTWPRERIRVYVYIRVCMCAHICVWCVYICECTNFFLKH